ncbi:glycoside hydrolase [Chryseobacterium sp. PMSZPI]|uniref:glycoside hydrolase n=1 Tax=Chryseobacterium sp. PMSZPI TaxID=1033900 RepID=UPI000C348829|nr:glycoside hydrolase [Chryseobacterium sp. PMSZPI]PKF75199.1 glycoside hydrolase [Chryseobacterium sp. PMSZPI]
MIYLQKKYISTRTGILLLIVMTMAFSTLEAVIFHKDTLSIKLNGPWKFKTGDQPIWADPNFDDSAWENVDLTASPDAHDSDVGLTSYTGGWTSKGHPKYSGYAWYRIKVPLEKIKGNRLALTGPPAVDDAYQLFVNGVLLGSAGDFTTSIPVAYSIQPRIFLLPESIRNEKQIIIAIRVWMSSATIGQIPDAGGIHIAPELGEKNSIESKYKFQWGQTIKGYIVEVIEPIFFILLALLIFYLYKPSRQYQWFIIALILLAMVRANQAFYYWLQIESSHEIDVVTTVILMPLALGSWIMAWKDWFAVNRPWIPNVIFGCTLIYMGSQLLALPWLSDSIPHSAFQSVSKYVRLVFAIMMMLIIYSGIQKQGKRVWFYLPAVLLVSIGLFAQELSELHIQGIWFPYGVGVSRSQYAYAAFVVVMFILLMYERKAKNIKG